MPFFWRNKLLLLRTKATYGISPGPTGLANAILVKNIKIMPFEGQDMDHALDNPCFGQSGSIPLDAFQKISFETELQGSGTAGNAPGWRPLALACGMSQTVAAAVSVTYSPVDTGQGSATIHMNVNGVNFVISGARGTCKLQLDAQGIPVLAWEFTGLYQAPTAVAMPTPTYTAFPDPQGATRINTPTFTVNGVSLEMKSFAFDVGNQIENRFVINSHEVLIANRMESCEFTIQTPTLASFNPWALAELRTPVALALLHGRVAGWRVALTIPALQIQRPASFDQDQGVVVQTINAIPLRASATAALSIVCT